MTDLKKVKAELERRLSELTSRASDIEESLSTPGSQDWEENATESEDDEVMSRLGDVTEQEIHEIRLALSRIESGQYGTCSACGKQISAERLTALPGTNTCVKCAT